MMTENPRYQTAEECAGAAIEALLTVYWAESFNADSLQARLADTIHTYTCNARSLKEPPNPKWLAEEQESANLSHRQ